MQMLRLEQVSIGYTQRDGSHKTVVEDINASMEDHCLTCLIGVNGAGKSTLFRTLCGAIRPLSGQIFLENRVLSDFSRNERAQRISVVLTERMQHQMLTVEELVLLGRAPYTNFWGNPTENDRAAVEKAMQLTNISQMREREVSRLSDGERQKAFVAMALAQETPVILLDEPTAFLDYPSKIALYRMLNSLAKDAGKSILFSTHDLDMALRISDCVWYIDNKRLIAGTPTQIRRLESLNRMLKNAEELDKNRPFHR